MREGDHGRVRLGGRDGNLKHKARRGATLIHTHTHRSRRRRHPEYTYVYTYIPTYVCMFVSHLMHFALSRRVFKRYTHSQRRKWLKAKA